MGARQEDFQQLMERVRAGSPEAAREVFELYSGHVRRVVRRQLHQRLRSQYDSLDLLQAVWASFFQVPVERYTFASPDDLIPFLSRLAYNKVVEVFRRHFQTGQRNLNREQPL